MGDCDVNLIPKIIRKYRCKYHNSQVPTVQYVHHGGGNYYLLPGRRVEIFTLVHLFIQHIDEWKRDYVQQKCLELGIVLRAWAGHLQTGRCAASGV
ncbi:hypothetical protein QTP88_006981 [Uroleucon formosanum]